MLPVLEIIFWFLVAILWYTYFGYGLILWVCIQLKNIIIRDRYIGESGNYHLPKIALLVPAFNEAEHIEAKIRNCLSLEYPVDKLTIIIISDGSTDPTPSLIRNATLSNNIIHLHEPERLGKAQAINRGMEAVGEAELVVFSDANSLLNRQALLKMLEQFANPDVGGVAGEKKIKPITGTSLQEKGEGLYWKYESMLKKIDSDFYTVVGAAGELFSLRRILFDPIPPDTILDDFQLSIQVCKKGYRVKYEPGAFAVEGPSLTLKEEMKRRKRISAGCFQALSRHRDLLNPFQYGKLSFQFISRRFLRWAVCPFALAILFVINWAILAFLPGKQTLYLGCAILQTAFYLAALAGWIRSGGKYGEYNILYIPFYFVFMHFSVWAGFIRFLGRQQPVNWEKAGRYASN